MAETGFFSDGERGLLHPTTPELRVKDQDLDGVSGEVIYGILGLAGGLAGFETMEGAPDMGSDDTPGPGYGISDPEAITAVYGIYNEWLAAFCKSKPNRFAGLICINGHDPQLAANQVRSGAKNGLRGGEMNVATTVEPIYHRDWDVLWAAASETNMPISFHTTGLIPRMPNKADVETYKALARDVSSNQFQLSGAEYLSSIILSGACDRFPDLKFVLGECGVGWIPYLLHRMDDEYGRHISRQNLSAKPTEFWYRQGYSTFQIEYLTNEMVGFIGEDNIMWGSDYPHPDGVWPDSRQVIEENLAHLNKRALKKIVCDNTARLYGFQN
jgi:predicted TIM-barrel fold metal-dependent hydrolase